VLLSSHLLHEVEQIADEMILIGRGKIVAQGDRATLLAGAGPAQTLVTSLDNAALAAALEGKGVTVEQAGQGLRVHAAAVEVGRAALEAQVVLSDLRDGGAGLEDLFLQLTADTQREGAPAFPAPTPEGTVA
jgi:ABC-2 type transport system ATP-binding protein